MTLDVLSLGDFVPLVGQRFEVDGSDLTVELLSATGLRHASVDGRTGFTLMFRGDRTRPLGQGIRAFAHPALGRVDIFIVPVALGPQGFEYEAVFN